MRRQKRFTAPLLIILALLFAIVWAAGGSAGASESKSLALGQTPSRPQETGSDTPDRIPGEAIYLLQDPRTVHYHVPPPQEAQLGIQAATINIQFLPAGATDTNGRTCYAWSSASMNAMNYAASIWGSQINSTVPIVVQACQAAFPDRPTALGYGGAWDYFRNYPGAPQANTWYPVALANALSGTDRNAGAPEIFTTYNKDAPFYYGTDGTTPAGQFDLVSVTLHEIAHGLGFSGSMRVQAGQGSWGSGTTDPFRFDRFTRDAANNSLINPSLYPNPSIALATALQSGQVYFDGPHARAGHGGVRVKLYAPNPWVQGSSYSHLDYNTYVNTPHRLMVYLINAGTSIHNPGSVTMGIFRDLGWSVPIVAASKIYLPGIVNLYPRPVGATISGQVRQAGVAAAGVPLSLRFHNGSAWSTAATTTTSGSGHYSFTGVPPLGANQKYSVRFGPNSTHTNRVWYWWGPDITTLSAGMSASGGNFDIANVSMSSPASGTVSKFPVTFRWQTRGIAGDTYRWWARDPGSDRYWYQINATNGGQFTVDGLPEQMQYGKEYRWSVRVYSGNNGYGESFYYRRITFQQGLAGVDAAAEGIEMGVAHEDEVKRR